MLEIERQNLSNGLFFFHSIEASLKRVFSGAEVPSLYVTDTYQFEDYSKYEVTMFNGDLKAKRRKEEFPKDCQKVFEMGKRLIQSLQ